MSVALSTKFEYDRLENDSTWFRLILLSPGKFDEDIDCTLVEDERATTSFRYDALSYTWGDATALHTIKVNSHDFLITKNLYDALRQIRMETVEVILWVDAICINQTSLIEKSHQVGQMRAIYQNAKEVLVWLGPDTTQTAYAFTWIDDFAAIAAQQVDESVRILDKILPPHDSLSMNDISINGKTIEEFMVNYVRMEFLDDFDTIMSRSWWKRVWVIQEVVVNPEVSILCGRWRIPWVFVTASVYAIYTSRKLSPSVQRRQMYQRALAMERRQQDFGDTYRMKLLNLLLDYAGAEASDARDNVYALIGLAADIDSGVFQPDYTIPAAEVYKRLVKFFLDTKGDLTIICTSQSAARSNHVLPSWAPDWSVPRLWSHLAGKPGSSTDITIAFAKFSNDLQVLHVSGTLLGIIEDLTEPYAPSGSGMKSWLEYIHQWRVKNGVHTFEPLLPSRRTVQNLEQMIAQSNAHTAEGSQDERSSATEYITNFDGEVLVDFKHDLDDIFQHRRFATSSSSTIPSFHKVRCLVPETALVGDHLVMLSGCQLPVVLHPVGSDWVLVGEAYIADYKHAQAKSIIVRGSELQEYSIK